jgi:6-phosphogluconolactonase
VHWRWGDEPFVALKHRDSNDHRASETLLVQRLAPPSNIHPALTDRSSPDEAASRYTGELAAFYGADRLDPQRPLVEAVLPGLDRTRHTASLFSGSPALNERQRWVTPAIGYEARPLVRVALTPPVLGSMKATAFLVSCIDKRSILVKILGGLTKVLAPRLWIQGSITWFAIESAWSEGSEDISPTGTAAGVTGSQLC